MRKKLYLELIYAMLFAFVVNAIVYFSFSNVYSSASLNIENFIAQYSEGVYQYRFLSSFLLIKIYELIAWIDVDFPLNLFLWDEHAEKEMLLSFFFLNTIFLCLFSMSIVYLFRDKTRKNKLMLMSFLVFVIVISQYIIVPYDVSSYFFIVVFFLFFSKFIKTKKIRHLVLPIFILSLATINRESSALLISLSAALLYFYHGLNKKSIWVILILSTVFVIIYFMMRLFFESFTTNDGNLLLENLMQIKNYFGVFFSIIFFSFLMGISDAKKRKLIIVFHAFSLPYIFMCFYTGILYEIRLYIPLLIASVLMSEFSFERQNTMNSNE